MSNSSKSSRSIPYRPPEVEHLDPHDRKELARRPVEAARSRAQNAREKMIAMAEMKDLQKRLDDCYFKSGENHYVVCKPLVEEYLRRLKDPDYLDRGSKYEVARVKTASVEHVL